MNRITSHVDSGRRLARLLALLALISLAFGVMEWVVPTPPPFKGRLAWVLEASVALAGPSAIAFLWFLLGLGLLLAARFVWRHTSKVPADRWL